MPMGIGYSKKKPMTAFELDMQLEHQAGCFVNKNKCKK